MSRMHMLDYRKRRVALELVRELPTPAATNRTAIAPGRTEPEDLPRRVVQAGRAVFRRELRVSNESRRASQGPAIFRDPQTGLLRVIYREITVRFAPNVPERRRAAILRHYQFKVRRRCSARSNQVVTVDRSERRGGADLLDIANQIASLDEVVFAAPNFVSEYRRAAAPSIPASHWHLLNRARIDGQRAGEDVNAREAWRITTGSNKVVIAIVDDGVDIDHPDLKPRLWKNPNAGARDKHGRDFFYRAPEPGHFDPRPKTFQQPYDDFEFNDIHGTACAGVAAASGRRARGIAFGCRLLPVKIFHADAMVEDERVADAIRYAARFAHVVSCSWTGTRHPDVEAALDDAHDLGVGGRGAVMFCAAGNEYGDPVGFPASDPNTIAVGASTDRRRLASYSNVGPQLDIVAPSGGGEADIFTTDVSVPNRGFNLGLADAGGTDGLYTNNFSGTSSATPLAAGIAALMLSVKPNLTADEVRSILCETAEKIGAGYDSNGHSNRYGFGRVDAARAVAEASR